MSWSGRRAQLLFVVVLLAFAAVAVWLAWLEPIVGDCWFGVEWRRVGGSLASLHDRIAWNYRVYNPRFGETFLYITTGWPAVHVVLTPIVMVALVLALMILALGRWPRPRDPRDTGLLVVAIGLLCLGVWDLGAIWCYRPYATNYLYGACLQAWLLVPLRLPSTQARWWWAPGMLVLGAVAGMCNEHTGLPLVVAYAVLAWRRRPTPWVLAGLVGVIGGFAALLLAPANDVRHGGIGRQSLLDRAWNHGVPNAPELLGSVLRQAAGGLAVLAVAIVILAVRKRETRPPWPVIGFAGGAALGVTVTLLAVPWWEERLLLAPALLVIVAALAAIDHLCTSRRAFVPVVVTAAAVAVVHLALLVAAQRRISADYADREARIAAAGPDAVVSVPPIRDRARTRWSFGDDLDVDAWRPWLAYQHGVRELTRR